MLTPEGKEKVAAIVGTIKFLMIVIAMMAALWSAVASEATFLMIQDFISHIFVEENPGVNIKSL